MLNILTSKLYETIVLGILGIALVIVSSLNIKFKVLSDSYVPQPGDVFCTKVPQNVDISNLSSIQSSEKHTTEKAVALLWTAFIAGILLIVHASILLFSMYSTKSTK